ncbi:hypothetical protein BP5796_06482 [Coleophoma crateriformis]|uniref:Uncharacterized protein n=1 Tax=Coleophoma crateriformis TaxID=565419 RepID=A0A3D8RPC6_9HELO|nr:hypothetical protein BP5796_06482 [Coleophoma crateriformis]
MASIRESTSSASPLYYTPSTTSSDSLRHNGLRTPGSAMRWQDARDKCLANLRLEERAIIRSFTSPEHLIADLQRREAEYSETISAQFISQIFPCISTIQDFSLLFLASMGPATVEVTFLWGILHLALKGLKTSQTTRTKTVEMLYQIRNELALFKRFSAGLNDDEEMRHAQSDMFSAMINFWSKAVGYLRKRSANVFSELLPQLDGDFKAAIIEMESSVERIHKIASFANRATEFELTSRNLDLLHISHLQESSSSNFPCYIIPFSNPYFYGRDKEMKAMAHHLDPPLEPYELRSYIVHGLGGVGKTALALAFAHRSRMSGLYDSIFWVKAKSHADLQNSFADIAASLKLSDSSQAITSDSSKLLVKNWLYTTRKRWLLIYDNVESWEVLEDFLPSSSGTIIITSRYSWIVHRVPGWRDGCALELETFTEKESFHLFTTLLKMYNPKASPASEKEAITTLLKKMNGHALGIEQIAAHIGYRRYSVKQFMAKYERRAAQIHSKKDHSSTSLHTVATVWEMHFENIQDTDSANLLALLSFLSPDDIPIQLFLPESELGISDFAPFCGDDTKLEDALDLLMHVALIKRHGENISLHPLVQAAYLESSYGRGQDIRQQAFHTVTVLVNDLFPKKSSSVALQERWAQCAVYLPHVLTLAAAYAQYSKTDHPLRSSSSLVELFKNSTHYQNDIGELHDCLKLLAIARDACTDKTGLPYSFLSNTTSCIYYELNDLPLCKKYQEETLAIRQAMLSSTDPGLGNIIMNIACRLTSEWRLDESLDLFQASKKIKLKDPNVSKQYLAHASASCGRVHMLKKEFELAEPLLTEARVILESLGPGGQFELAFIMFDIGKLGIGKGDVSAATKAFYAGLELSKNAYPMHILTGSYYFKLGVIAANARDFKGAREHLEKAFCIAEYQRIPGQMARIMRKQAMVLAEDPESNLNELAEGRSLRIRAAQIKGSLTMNSGLILDRGWTEDEVYDNLVVGHLR